MHRFLALALAAAALGPSPSPAENRDAAAAERGLPAHLEGCWRRDGPRSVTVERWLPPSGDTMLGVSETRRGDATVAWEFLRVVLDAEGTSYVAWPSGQQPTRFVRVAAPGGAWVFENPGHDFPQRIVYPAPVDDRLEVRIEGARDGETRVIGLPMRRVPCAQAWAPTVPADGEVEGAAQSG